MKTTKKKKVTRADLLKLMALIRGEEYAILHGENTNRTFTVNAAELMARAEKDELNRLLEAKL